MMETTSPVNGPFTWGGQFGHLISLASGQADMIRRLR